MAVESTIFKQKFPHTFSDTDPSNLIISRFYTLWAAFFHYKTHKLFSIEIKFQVNLAEVSLRPFETNLTEKLKTFEISQKGS